MNCDLDVEKGKLHFLLHFLSRNGEALSEGNHSEVLRSKAGCSLSLQHAE